MKNLGQLIFTGISGLTLSEDEKSFLENEDIGGVLLFSKNFESPAQLSELINSIQTLRQEYPLFISVDQEGGRVQRFKKPFAEFPAMREISKLDSPKIIYEVYKIIAEELSVCGVNVNFAPVADIVTSASCKAIGDRSFGSDPQSVEKFVSAAIRGLQTSDVLACVKHFPGHGLTTKDTHDELPFAQRSLEELQEWDLIPFVKAIKSRVEFVMISHIIVSAFDSELPCTMSPECYKFLRENLKFSKIIISDDMQMGAIQNHFDIGEAAVKTLVAGCDMLEYRDMDKAREALEAIKLAYQSGKIERNLLLEKLGRVKDCKKKQLKDYRPVFIPDISKTFSLKSSKIFSEDLLTKISKKK